MEKLADLWYEYENGIMFKKSWNSCASEICGFLSEFIDVKGGNSEDAFFWNFAHAVWEDGNLTEKDLDSCLSYEKPEDLTEEQYTVVRISLELLKMLPPFDECQDYEEDE